MRALDVSQSSLLDAALWVQHTLLGGVAISIAVLAVATLGAMMLTGRVDMRRATTVVIGCFILFGAPAISTGIKTTLEGSWQGSMATGTSKSLEQDQIRPFSSDPFDPYAGSKVSQQR